MLNKKLEKEFWKDIAANSIKTTRIAALAGLTISVLGLVEGAIYYSGFDLYLTLVLKTVTILYISACLYLLFTRQIEFFIKYYNLIIAPAIFLVTIPLSLESGATEFLDPVSYIGVVEAGFTLVTFLTLSRRVVLTGIIFCYLFHLAFRHFIVHDPLDWHFLDMLKQMSIFLFITVVAHHILLKSKKENFLQRHQLQLAYTKLSELDQVKSDFVANISHEIRTPLTLILTPLRALMKSVSGEASIPHQILEQMVRNGERLLGLINNLLDLSRMEAGRLELSLSRLELTGFVANVAASFEAAAAARGLWLKVENQSRELFAYIDLHKLEKILFNLLGNALKFTNAGGITIGVKQSGSMAQILVSDTGIGISDESRDLIFERFRQGSGGAARQYEGTGLGLHLVKRFTEMHDGRVLLKANPGGGSIFIVELPLEQKSHAPSEPDALSCANTPDVVTNCADADKAEIMETVGYYLPANQIQSVERRITDQLERPALLIVEDNSDMRDYLQNLLKTEYNIRLATNGHEALHILERQRVDLIVSDVMMPEMSGYDLLRSIRQSTLIPTLPVILLTARAEVGERIKGLVHGADDYLPKPFHADELIARIRRALDRSRARELAVARSRDRIYADLHDNLGARLTDLSYSLNHLETENNTASMAGVEKNMRRVMQTFRDSLSTLEDLDLLRDDFLDGMHLILLRRYAGCDRVLTFHYEDGLSEHFSRISRQTDTDHLYAIFQEIATNDLKYGSGASCWEFRLAHEGAALEIDFVSKTHYEGVEKEQSYGQTNIARRLEELQASCESLIEDGIYHMHISLPLSTAGEYHAE